MIKLLLLDVDGVMTDGGIIYDENGIEFKKFDVKDGLGINLAKRAGIHICIISGRFSEVTNLRAAELGIDEVYQNVRDKQGQYEEIKLRLNIDDCEAAFIGDDINDLKLLRRVGFSATVSDADDSIKEHASAVMSKPGGCGAVREFIEKILKNNGIWEKTIEHYF